jgi:hypothetical protein
MRMITPERVLESVRGVLNGGEVSAPQDLVHLTIAESLRL